MDSADQANQEMEQHLEAALCHQHQQQECTRSRRKPALRCHVCELPIESERRRTLPDTLLCSWCAAELEMVQQAARSSFSGRVMIGFDPAGEPWPESRQRKDFEDFVDELSRT